jgi:hypothetical protein
MSRGPLLDVSNCLQRSQSSGVHILAGSFRGMEQHETEPRQRDTILRTDPIVIIKREKIGFVCELTNTKKRKKKAEEKSSTHLCIYL